MTPEQRDQMIAEAEREVRQARILTAAENGCDLDEDELFLTHDNGIKREVLAALMVFEKWTARDSAAEEPGSEGVTK